MKGNGSIECNYQSLSVDKIVIDKNQTLVTIGDRTFRLADMGENQFSIETLEWFALVEASSLAWRAFKTNYQEGNPCILQLHYVITSCNNNRVVLRLGGAHSTQKHKVSWGKDE